MILSDSQISDIPALIEPFTDTLKRQVVNHPVISYGLSSFGYDLRLSREDFRIFRHIPGTVVDPKRFNPDNLEQAELHTDNGSEYFILPGHSYGLGVAMERLSMPGNVTGICLGKSTYARSGGIVNMTPVEAGWVGYLTIEISNSSHADMRVYAGEGICQIVFLQHDDGCETTYEDRKGKYQGQKKEVTLPRI